MRKGVKCSDKVELRHLRYFVAVVEHGSFRKAGAAVGRSQAAISRSIAKLEDEIGASLFHRHTWGVSQTYAGQRFLVHARRVIRTVGEGAREVASAGRSEKGRVRIGIYSSIASGFLAELLEVYGRRHSAVRIEVADGNPAEHVAAIRQLNLDVAFITGTRDWPDCERVLLWSERVFVVLPDHHALANREEVVWRDLADESFIVSETAPGQEIYDHLVRRLADLGRHPEIQVQYVGRDNLVPLVALGRGLTLVSEAITVAQFPGVVYRPILGEVLPFSAVWSASNDNPAFRRFLSLAKAMAVRPATSETGRSAVLS
ncbi:MULTISPECIES: LysR family transcriptional regulator [Alphaproteobacteria]|jgi:DNA-binding transcriptional LysR family regulator|uniref:LysR family transcriptional regulator n=9 Tax=Alphaproteobacteria TaxID=28211 RepID=A0A316J4X8_9HYPH|nr:MULTISPECIES: LysR family transcriptional regulator [Alphaproteobacteria]ANV26637.1 LysR family transcriptional regulator [Rhizobium sp. S41]MAM12639.1 LysR family transcriptional regulator [Rhizobiaceae bacterium]MAS11874.1 LysR family transcriptional regulator [Nitratireductor sp.]ABS15931.1 transcriptional regulator, LysR family [Brucella anthropi ATCC 49188]AIK42834.1 bacterial regulatory helix-turn-helix, lysR family protein [Brucella anthropi]